MVNLVKLLYWWSNVERHGTKSKDLTSSYHNIKHLSQGTETIYVCIKVNIYFVGENATVFIQIFINLVFHSSKRDKSYSKTIKLTRFCVLFMLSKKIVHIKL